MQPSMIITISHLALPSGNITYHDIIAFNQELSVKGTRNFKCLRNFPSSNLNLNDRGKKEMQHKTAHFTVVHT